jgi:hypothetical protein
LDGGSTLQGSANLGGSSELCFFDYPFRTVDKGYEAGRCAKSSRSEISGKPVTGETKDIFIAGLRRHGQGIRLKNLHYMEPILVNC